MTATLPHENGEPTDEWLESNRRSSSNKPVYNAEWDGRPAEYAELRDCWLTRRRALHVADFLRAARPAERVLDVGSGVGELVTEMAVLRPDLQFTGVEPQESYVEFATRTAARRGVGNVEFRVGSADQLAPLFERSRRFEWILSNDMLHHVPDEERVLRAAAEVATPAARWLTIEPNWRNLYVLAECALKPGERNFRPRRFLARAEASGWSCLDRSYLFLIPSFVKRPPRTLVELERIFERYALLAGGVALTLARRNEPEHP